MDLNHTVKPIYVYINENINAIQSKYYNNIGLRTEDVFNLIEYHDSYKDLYPNYSDENQYEEDYYFSSIQDAYKDANEILTFFSTLPNPIPIYRSIKVESINNIDYNWLGDSWSFDKQSAINFAKNQANGNVLLSAKTNFDNVDWKNTVRLYYLFSSNYDSYDENEIKIIDSDEIFNVKTEMIK